MVIIVEYIIYTLNRCLFRTDRGTGETTYKKAILKKTYTLNYKAFGARVGNLIVDVNKGKSDEVAQSILKKYKNNVAYCHTVGAQYYLLVGH